MGLTIDISGIERRLVIMMGKICCDRVRADCFYVRFWARTAPHAYQTPKCFPMRVPADHPSVHSLSFAWNRPLLHDCIALTYRIVAHSLYLLYTQPPHHHRFLLATERYRYVLPGLVELSDPAPLAVAVDPECVLATDVNS